LSWTRIQGVATNQSGTGVFGSNVVAGNLLVVDIFIESVGATVASITDTLGTVYVAATGYGTLTGIGVCITYIGLAPSSGANTVSITSSAGVINNLITEMHEDSTGPSTTVDVLGTVAGGNSTTPTSNSITTTTSGALLWGTVLNQLVNYSSGLTAGWTHPANADSTFNEIFDNFESLANAASPGSYSFTTTYAGSAPWVVQIFAIKPKTIVAAPLPASRGDMRQRRG